ncbi:DUF6236 family protein [Streptomyces sp. VNUA116]|uniref:DUF6236 family protein n=1 Tax=Streptomyces sp. VNUA116 TaxID=3062449 RepID=UPI0026756E67|nr:DUF6236 family protein [Streptomyces sp. VNUA116]WKU48042.1 DUF6236 family protein [Streptomyces sp. VNUA116]
MPSIALYYPWMHFQDDNWLKVALLTWGRIVRMRPGSVEDRDRELVRQLCAETDFIVEAAPSPMVLTTVAEKFTEIIDADPDRIVERYGLSEEIDPGPHDLRYSTDWLGYEPPLFQGTWDMVRSVYMLQMHTGGNDSKMATVLSEKLVGMGLAEPSGGPWVRMHPKLGSIYLAVLTDVMARSEMLSPATDDLRMHKAVGALDQLTNLLLDDHTRGPAIEHAENAYMHVALRTVIEPERLAAVPVAKLIRFREAHGDELAAFHEHVASLTTELQAIAEVENLEVASAHLRSLYESKTRPQLNELRRALRAQGIESSAGTLVQKVNLNAAAGTLLGSVAAAGGQLAVASAAVAVTLVPYIAGKVEARRQQVGASPVAYLLAADRELSGRTLLGALQRRTHRG